MTQRTSTEVAEELALYRQARTALVTGERVESVNRDGRGMRLASLSLDEVNSAIRDLQREYEQALAVEEQSSGRRAIGFTY